MPAVEWVRYPKDAVIVLVSGKEQTKLAAIGQRKPEIIVKRKESREMASALLLLLPWSSSSVSDGHTTPKIVERKSADSRKAVAR